MSGILGGYLDSSGVYITKQNVPDVHKNIENRYKLKHKDTNKMEENKNPVTGVGVPDGDGGSLEREDKKDNLTRENNSSDDDMMEDEEDVNPLEDEGDWAENPDAESVNATEKGNSLGNDSDNGREKESIEGALNNPGVNFAGTANFSMLKYFNIEFN